MRLIFIAIFCFANLASAKNAAFNSPVYGGSGCHKNNTVAVLSPNGSALSILFNDYLVLSGGSSSRTFTVKNCDIQIPIEIPSGFQAFVIGADFRGYNDLPCNAKSTLTVEYGFSNGSLKKHVKTFLGPLRGENYLVQYDFKISSVRSECGKNTVFKIKNYVSVQTNSQKMQATSVIDSADFSIDSNSQNGITLYLAWTAC